MHCLACDKMLSDREASRKFEKWEEISNPEERYVGLCNNCLKHTGLTFTENPNACEETIEDESFEDEAPAEEEGYYYEGRGTEET